MHNEQCPPYVRSVSWQAIIGGTLVAIGLTFLFSVLTIAIGLSTFSPGHAGKMMLTYGGFAWMLIGFYIILFVSGWVTGRIVSQNTFMHCGSGFLHGFITWTLYLIISMFVLTHMVNDASTVLLRTAIVNAEINTQTGAETTEAEAAPHTNPMHITEAIHKGGFATFASFFMLLIGALGCSIGGCYGIRECRKSREYNTV